MGIPKILQQLLPDGDAGAGSATGSLSSTTTSVLAEAVSHQESASDSRLGVQVRRGPHKPEPTGLPRFKNLSKSSSILAERKGKKADWVEQQSMKGPKFSITLWKSRGVEDKPKLVSSK